MFDISLGLLKMLAKEGGVVRVRTRRLRRKSSKEQKKSEKTDFSFLLNAADSVGFPFFAGVQHLKED